MDVGNKLGVTEITTDESEDTKSVSTSEFVFVSSFTTSTPIPLDTTDGVTSSSVSPADLTTFSYVNNDGDTGKTNKVLTLESSASPAKVKSALSQVGNVIFQLLGEEGYNSFSCNLTTADDNAIINDAEGKTMYRRINKKLQANQTANDTFEKIEFQPVDSNTLPELPKSIRDDQKIKILLRKFNILELCNFTSKDHENISKKLTSCSNGISKLKLHVNDKAKIVLDKYSQALLKAAKKFKVIQESKMKIVKIINLTDYLLSTIKDSAIPKELKNDYHELKQFLLVELKNEDLNSFHPESNRKDLFMAQLFDYLIQSKVVDSKKKKLLEMFKKFIRNS